MAGLDLFATQQAILEYLKTKTIRKVDTGGVPEADSVWFNNGNMEPYIVLRFSEIMPASKGNNWGGAAKSEYYSYVDALCVGKTDTDARELSSLVNRAMLGKKFDNTSEIRKIFGGGGFAVADSTRIPVAYVSIASFAFNTNLSDPGAGSIVT